LKKSNQLDAHLPLPGVPPRQIWISNPTPSQILHPPNRSHPHPQAPLHHHSPLHIRLLLRHNTHHHTLHLLPLGVLLLLPRPHVHLHLLICLPLNPHHVPHASLELSSYPFCRPSSISFLTSFYLLLYLSSWSIYLVRVTQF